MDKLKGKIGSIKILIVILLCILFLAVGYYLVFTLKVFRKSTNEQETYNDVTGQDTESELENNGNVEFILFEGEHISASLPTSWRIEEYVDGQGSTMLTPGETYSGLTGLKIYKEDTLLFSMQAVSGLGFSGCPNYARFPDESKEYYEQTLIDNEVSGQELNIQDFTSSSYSEFEWLGVSFRRVGNTYVYDTISGNDYFESSCVFTLVSFYDLTTYRIDGKYGSSAYDFGATQSATTSDLETIDDILDSMALLY